MQRYTNEWFHEIINEFHYIDHCRFKMWSYQGSMSKQWNEQLTAIATWESSSYFSSTFLTSWYVPW